MVDRKMQKFQHRSSNNIPGVTRMRACLGSGFLPPPGISLAKNKGGGKLPQRPPAQVRSLPSMLAHLRSPQALSRTQGLIVAR